MTRTIRIPIAAGAVLLGAACGEPAVERSDGPPEPAHSGEPVAVCLRGESFRADGALPLEEPAAADAERIAGLRWEAHEGCERFVIDLEATEGVPATGAGNVQAEVLRGLGVVRVTLRDVEWVATDATDATYDGPLARAAYAVWAPEGRWTFVDLHLAEPAEAHASVLRDPARVVIDLRPGGSDLGEAPAIADRVVVLRPRAGSASYPLTVTGYARTFEANVVARIEGRGEEGVETFTTATAWVDAWGHYSLTIEEGPLGAVVLRVGEHSARDGTWEGVAVPLDIE